ncbi:hypothetical protein ABID30_003645 [Enterococcus rotai]|uniref:DUF5067 domain-containing protein n=1 Tax=Enterococcus rotai TaxID=118060 RepID=A0A0U2WMY3_9ENTE|nr:hypothetical protein [Enterococcus rotai]ALS36614.1 hypothetical protein ATZ35_05390 [Enterococcus rotai]
MTNNRRVKFTLTFLILILLTACQKNTLNNSVESSSQTTANSLTDNQKKTVDNGHRIGKYTVLLSENNKKSEQDIATFIENDFFEKAFLNVESRIDPTKKLNILTYSMHYSPEEERYTLGVFFINSSKNNINSIKMLLKPNFKNISEGEFIEVNFEGDDFPNLPVNGVSPRTISANAPIEYLDRLKENTGSDITFEIKDLELNGEKVNNTNEN